MATRGEVWEKTSLFYSQILERRHCTCGTTWERFQDDQDAKARGRFRPLTLLGFPWKRQVRQSEQFRMSYLNNFGRALGFRSGPWLSGFWPWMIKAEEYCLWGVRARWRRCGSGLFRLHIKGMLLLGFLAIFKNWLAHHKYRKGKKYLKYTK